jgi:maleate cis-trans isomerase
LSSSLCNIWYALHCLRVREKISGYGRLLSTLA